MRLYTSVLLFKPRKRLCTSWLILLMVSQVYSVFSSIHVIVGPAKKITTLWRSHTSEWITPRPHDEMFLLLLSIHFVILFRCFTINLHNVYHYFIHLHLFTYFHHKSCDKHAQEVINEIVVCSLYPIHYVYFGD